MERLADLYLAEITVCSGVTLGEAVLTTLKFSTGDYVTKRSDTPSDTAYLPYIKDAGNIEQHLYSSGKTSGASAIGVGTLELVNADGSLDYLMPYGFDGRDLTIYRIEPNAAYSTKTLILKATMQQAEFSNNLVSIRVRDNLEILNNQHVKTLYAGDNSLPYGTEGVATDLKDKPKPKLYGKVFNIAPPCVNTSKLIYQVSKDLIYAIDNVYHRGVALTPGTAQAVKATFLSTIPVNGTFDTYLAEGLFKLGADIADGGITCDARQDIAAYSAPYLFFYMWNDSVGSDMNLDDIIAVNAVCPGEAGIWINDTATSLQVADTLAESFSGWYGTDIDGTFRMGILKPPENETSSFTLTTDAIKSLEKQANHDSNNGLPCYAVRLKYKKNYTAQGTGELASAVTIVRRNELEQEYLTAFKKDDNVLIKHPLAGIIERTTLLVNKANAENEAQRLLDLYSVERATFVAECVLTASQMNALNLGQTIEIIFPRYGLDGGKNFIFIGLVRELETNKCTLTLWG